MVLNFELSNKVISFKEINGIELNCQTRLYLLKK